MPNPWFQMFGVNLLLATPSSLGRAWTKYEDSKFWEEEVVKLNLSGDAQIAAMSRMARLQSVNAKGHFKAAADALKTVAYSGSEPHPNGRDAAAIVTMLRALDDAFSVTSSSLTQARAQLEALALEIPPQSGRVQAIAEIIKAAQNPIVVELQEP